MREQRGMMRAFLVLVAAAVILLAQAGGAKAAGRGGAGLFREGSMRLSVLIGSGTAFGENYTIIGAGFGYYVIDNLEVGFEGESWQGGDPGMTRLSPQVQYVFPVEGTIRPYAGAFYRRTFIDQYKDLNDAGAKAGVLFLYGRNVYLGAGIVYEQHLACDRNVYSSCGQTYPEILVAIIF